MMLVTIPLYLGPTPMMPLALAILGAPPAGWAIRKIQSELFELEETTRGFLARLVSIEVLAAPIGVVATGSILGAAAWQRTGSPVFAVEALAGALATGFGVLALAVAVPLHTARPGVPATAIALVSVYAVLRRPVPIFSVAAVITVLAGAALALLPSLIVVVAILTISLSVAAAWPTLSGVDVALPQPRPTARNIDQHEQGES